jgi:hypothetical protein
MSSNQGPLSYRAGLSDPQHKRRRVVTAGFIGLTVVLVAFTWPRVRPFAAQSGYLRWQEECMGYVDPPSRIVYDDHPVRAAALLASDRAYHPPFRPLFNYPDNRPPPGWGPPAYFRPSLYRAERFFVAPSTPSPPVDGVALLHQRQTPSGTTRLVVVGFGCSAVGPDGRGLILIGSLYQPASHSLRSRLTAPPRHRALRGSKGF